MVKETITYTDYNGVERTETIYFHLEEAELMEMEMTTEGGLAEMIQKIVDAKDAPAIIKVFKDLVLKSYGVKSPDGRRFIKTEQLSQEFSQTPMYSKMFMKLATDDVAGAEFVKGIMPEIESDKKQAPVVLPSSNN